MTKKKQYPGGVKLTAKTARTLAIQEFGTARGLTKSTSFVGVYFMEFGNLRSTICAIVFGYVAFARNGKRDVADEAKSDATVLTEIGYIKANTDEIKAEQKEQRKTNVEVVTRLTAVEASAKQAHKRLDAFESRERREHEE